MTAHISKGDAKAIRIAKAAEKLVQKEAEAAAKQTRNIEKEEAKRVAAQEKEDTKREVALEKDRRKAVRDREAAEKQTQKEERRVQKEEEAAAKKETRGIEKEETKRVAAQNKERKRKEGALNLVKAPQSRKTFAKPPSAWCLHDTCMSKSDTAGVIGVFCERCDVWSCDTTQACSRLMVKHKTACKR
jgi:hypothetical protein